MASENTGASFTAVTFRVMVSGDALSAVPSFTLKVKLAYASPLAFAGGTYLRSPSSSWALVTVCDALLSATLSSCSSPVPAAGSDSIFTLASASPLSVSEKLKSAASNVCGVSSLVVTDPAAAVGAVLLATPTVAVSVPVAMPLVPPRPVTVRVKVSSVFAASGGIVTVGVALVSSSNVTSTPVVGLVSAQE